ncbi:MAG: SDR family oxidoreductase [Thalassobaculum sp.]|uniref:SDR family oxidoreductase n=1 Tax=Thalassobaculum sp. TaxID=2022740 RepID=UPI0032EF09CB
MQVRLDGRTALITGGSLGVGRAIATRFVEAGARVVIAARRAEVLEGARAEIAAVAGTAPFAVAADVADAAGCVRLVREAEAAAGPIDILVNNAGTSKRSRFLDIDDATWQADLDLKLFGAIRLARLLAPGMIERRWGRIINVLNTGAKAPPAEGAPTAVSRAAGMALTKVLAGELAPHNVLVNALLVGRIKSDQWVRRHAAAAAEGSNATLDDYYAEMGKAIPMRRVGEAEEFSAVACLLASDLGGYVTGTAINVDGGACPVV